MSKNRTILITGASSGFGLLVARTLLARGYTVAATMRDVEGRNAKPAAKLRAFAGSSPGTVHTLELDVTSDESVEKAVAETIRLTGHLDVVVNNAGYGSSGYAETFTIAQWRQIFEVNVFGVQRVIRAVLPAMRRAGSGLVVNVSSMMGRIVLPFAAPYTASKWALEGMSESYRYELAATGVDVVTVEPGGFPTGFGERMMVAADTDRVESYGVLADAPGRMWSGLMEGMAGEGAPDPQAVADTVLELIEIPAGRRPMRTVVDPYTGGEVVEVVNRASEEIQAQVLEAVGMAAPSAARA